MEGRGVLRVSAARRGPVVEVVFHDSGPGIAPGLADSLFEPFVTSKGEGEGSGLGLYISARIASDLGGSLRLADDGSGGGGARFVVALPAPPGP
jgi:C4-dicarboxylate-specific signal transduction histidine kinase